MAGELRGANIFSFLRLAQVVFTYQPDSLGSFLLKMMPIDRSEAIVPIV